MIIKNPNTIVISRTDSIGDVSLTLPLAGILKTKFPQAKLIFLGDTYTKPILKCSKYIDEIWTWSDLRDMPAEIQLEWLKSQKVDVFIHVFPRREIARLVQKARIPHKIGTSHRLFHMLTCNHKVGFTRKNSDLHESQLNVKLLKPFGIQKIYSLEELFNLTGFENIEPLNPELGALFNPNKKNIIFHSKSKGSALEWGVSNFIKASKLLSSEKYQIFFTGTEDESKFFRHLLPKQNNIVDLSGKMSLDQLIAFISKADGLLAASTGPLHIAGLNNIHTFGLFTPRKPLHYGRWQPLGKKFSLIEEIKASERDQPLNISVDCVIKMLEKI